MQRLTLALLLAIPACGGSGSKGEQPDGRTKAEAGEVPAGGQAEGDAGKEMPAADSRADFQPVAQATPEPLTLPSQPVPGFVLYTAGETAVLTAEVGEFPAVSVHGTGHWIQDETGKAPKILRRYDPLFDRTLPYCPCADIDRECVPGGSMTTVEGVLAPSTCACRQLLTEPVRAMPMELDGETFEPCRDDLGETEPVSVVGGQLFVSGWTRNGACYGALNLYDAVSEAYPLEGRPRRDFPASSASVGCTFDWGPVTIATPGELVSDKEIWDGDDDCEPEFEYAEGETWTLRRGFLWHVLESQSGAGGWLGVRRTRATPESCPSANDPCGDPKSFSFDGLGRRVEFWVENGGSLALTGRGINYRIHRPSQTDLPDPTALEGFEVERQLIGVRFHADVRPLIRMMRTNPAPKVAAPDPKTCPVGELHPLDAELTDPKVLGNRCVTRFRDSFYSSAEAACRHGLKRVEDDSVRGALLFNLAQIAKARRVPAYAKALLEQSLEVRPGNGPTKSQLRQLERELGAP